MLYFASLLSCCLETADVNTRADHAFSLEITECIHMTGLQSI